MVHPCDPRMYMEMPVYAQGVAITTRTSTEPDHPPTDQQMEIIRRSLGLIPGPHLEILRPPGHIQVSKPGCLPEHGGGNGAFVDQRWVRLSAASIGASHNRTFNVTLLHEFGHLVDHRYRAMESLRERDRSAYRMLATTAHEGATQGPGEAFADCYMIFLVTRIGRTRYNHPADPRAYQGQEAERRFEALLQTRAFDDIGAAAGVQH